MLSQTAYKPAMTGFADRASKATAAQPVWEKHYICATPPEQSGKRDMSSARAAYRAGIRCVEFHLNHGISWNPFARGGPVVSVVFDVFGTGERFYDYEDEKTGKHYPGYFTLLKQAYAEIPSLKRRKIWEETRQGGEGIEGMGSAVHMSIDNPARVLGMLKNLKDPKTHEPLFDEWELQKALQTLYFSPAEKAACGIGTGNGR